MTICPAPIDSTPLTAPRTVENWARALKFTAAKSYRPSTRGEIVEIIRAAEENNRRVKYGGSFWSFMGVFVSNEVLIESDRITGLIDKVLDPERLPLADPALRESLVHVRGGTKVFNVNRLLHGLNEATQGGGSDENNLPLTDKDGKRFRALPTMGGSGGQSIAGVLATGSHGGDVERSPLADWVQAIHLIGPGGQEWWIERTKGLTAGSEAEVQERLRNIAKTAQGAAEELCDGILVRKNDEVFRSVLVSVGRMGFVYSLVIKTVPAFLLAENRFEAVWESFKNNMRAAALPGYLAPPGNDRKFFVQVLINPFGTRGAHKCKVSERRVIEDPLAQRIKPAPGNDFLKWLCTISETRSLLPLLGGILAALLATLWLLSAAAGALLALAAALAPIPIIGWALAAAAMAAYAAVLVLIAATVVAIAAVVALIAYVIGAPSMTIGDLLANITALFYALGLKDAMKALFTSLLDSNFPLTPSLDVSWKIMDTYGYQSEDFCQKVDSMEVAFDATEAGADVHLAFIDEVLKIFDDLFQKSVPLVGVLALRYMRKTESLIGMTRFPFTCHIEIPILRNFGGNVEFLNRVQRAAIARGGVPHWGQLMATYNADDVQRLHGVDLDNWRTVLGMLIKEGAGQTFTFSNNFTLTYNLEPLDAGLPDDCATGGPYAGTTLGTLKGPGGSVQRVEGDVTLDRVDDSYDLRLTSLHGSITIKQKVDNKSSARLKACGAVRIGEKVDQKSEAFIWARGDVTIQQKVDQESRVEIESAKGNIDIGQKIDQKSRATLKAKGKVHIGQKIDQHSWARIVADGDVVIDEGIDQHSTAEITSLNGSILIGKAVDGNATVVLRAPNGAIKIGEKVAGGASVQWSAKSFTCPNTGGGSVTPI